MLRFPRFAVKRLRFALGLTALNLAGPIGTDKDHIAMDQDYRAGILSVSRALCDPDRLGWLLPPEHRVAARRRTGPGRDDYLVEGSSLPPARAGEVAPVQLLLSSEIAGPEMATPGVVTLSAAWAHAPEQRWRIGHWPNIAAMREGLDALVIG